MTTGPARALLRRLGLFLDGFSACFSRRPQRVTIGNSTIGFAANEALVSEHSHKYTLESFASLARAAGWRIEHVWLDSRGWFSLQWLVADPHSAADVSAAFGGRSPDRRTHRR